MKLTDYGISDDWQLLTRSTFHGNLRLADALYHAAALEKRCKGRRSVRRILCAKYNGVPIRINMWFDGNRLDLYPTWDDGTPEQARNCIKQAVKKFKVPNQVLGFTIKIT